MVVYLFLLLFLLRIFSVAIFVSPRVYLRFSFDFYVSKIMHLSRGSNGYARIDVRFSDKNDKSVQTR